MASSRRIFYKFRNVCHFFLWFGFHEGCQVLRIRLRKPRIAALRTRRLAHPVYFRPSESDFLLLRRHIFQERANVPLLEEPRVIIDGGANIGLFAVALANRFPTARVIAVEPAPDNLEVLRKNAAHYPNIKVVEGALWPYPAHLRIVDHDVPTTAYRVEELPTPQPGMVPACTVPDLLRSVGADHVDLLSLDIEGAEEAFFAHQPEAWLPRVRTLLVRLCEQVNPGIQHIFDKALTARAHIRMTYGHRVLVTLPKPNLSPTRGGQIGRVGSPA